MVKTAGKSYINTTVDSNVLRALKVLAAQKDKRLNQLLEEAITDLLKKYEKESSKKSSPCCERQLWKKKDAKIPEPKSVGLSPFRPKKALLNGLHTT